MSQEGVSIVLNERPEFKAIVEWIKEAASEEAKKSFKAVVLRWGGGLLRTILGSSFSESELALPEDWDPRGIIKGQAGLKSIRDPLLEGVLPETKDLILDAIWTAVVGGMTPIDHHIKRALAYANGDLYGNWEPGKVWRAPGERFYNDSAIANALSQLVSVSDADHGMTLLLVFDFQHVPDLLKDAIADEASQQDLAQELERFREELLAAFFKRLKDLNHLSSEADFNLTHAMRDVIYDHPRRAAAAKKELLSYARKGGARLSGAEDWDPRKSSGDRVEVIKQIKRWLSGEGLLGDASIYEDAGFPIGILMKGKLLRIFSIDSPAAARFREEFRSFLASVGTGMKYRQLDALHHILEIIPASATGPRLSGAEDWSPRRGNLNARGLFEAIHKWLVKRYGTNGMDAADLMLLEVLPPDLWEGATLAIKQQGQLFDIISRDDQEYHVSWVELMERLGYEVHEKYPFEFFFYPVS